MRVIATVLIWAACSDKATHSAAIDRYVNVEMQPRWAELWTAMRPLKSLGADAIVGPAGAGWIENAMTEYVIPLTTKFVDEAPRVTPPPPMADAHARIVELAKEYRAIGTEMLAAATGSDPTANGERFRAAHARAVKANDRYAAWQRDFDAVLAEHRVAMTDVPQLPPRPSEPDTHCGTSPCPCVAGTEVKRDDRLVACTLSEREYAYGKIFGMRCDPDRIAFDVDGFLASCTLAEDMGIVGPGPVTLHRNGHWASGTLQAILLAYASPEPVTCGPGPARWFEDDSVELCRVIGDATVGGIAIARRTAATVAFYRGGAPRYVEYEGRRSCFDPAGKPSEPCTPPSW